VAPRAELGKRLQTLIDRPERLPKTGKSVEAERCWPGEGLPNQGPVIRSQVSRLELLLPTFNQPVMLALESDNATEVAIQRVGSLGIRPARGHLEARQIHRHRQAERFPRRAPRDHRRPGQASRPS
jgi:hypothetical protein